MRTDHLERLVELNHDLDCLYDLMDAVNNGYWISMKTPHCAGHQFASDFVIGMLHESIRNMTEKTEELIAQLPDLSGIEGIDDD